MFTMTSFDLLEICRYYLLKEIRIWLILHKEIIFHDLINVFNS